MRITKMLLHATVAALTVAGLANLVAADDQGLAYGRSQAAAPLEGTWVMTIQPVFCTTTTAATAGDVIPGTLPVAAYLTFHRGGTMTESNSNAAFEPGQRAPGHGYWERTGRTSYQFTFQAFLQFDSTQPPFRYQRGYQRLDRTIELHTEDEFTTSGTVRFFTATATENPYIAGCVRACGVRLI